jgi:RNA polymerase sigma-70 factor (ECF subfamily)
MSESTRDGWFAAALTRFERPLVQYARRLLAGDIDRARDVVQDAFVRLLSQEDAQIHSRLAEWLFTVCRNRAAEIRRKEKRMTPLSDLSAGGLVAETPPPEELLERRETTAVALALLEELPDNQRTVLRLKFQHSMTYREISGATGLSESNVGFLIHTGIKTLRERLAETTSSRPKPEVQS